MPPLSLSDPAIPPSEACAYIEDMLLELADVASRVNEAPLAEAIRVAASLAHECSAGAWNARDRLVG